MSRKESDNQPRPKSTGRKEGANRPKEGAKPPQPKSARGEKRGNSNRQTLVKRVVAVSAVGLFAGYASWLWVCLPPSRTHIPIRIVIPKNSGLMGIGQILQQNGIVRSGLAFAFYASTHSGGREMLAGRHTLAGDMTLDQVIEALRHSDRSAEISVSIPEGFTLKQIAARLSTEGVTDKEAFLKAATSPEVIASLTSEFPLAPKTLEGYLFPDTYRFPPHIPAIQALQAMVLNFGARFARPYQTEIAGSAHSLHEIITIASMIEREAEVPEDRARIAGVIENRLRHKMRLEIDATVLYALGHHKPRVTYKDLQVRSPYNTYRHSGLPPGPIANPGLACLLAALHPEQNDYLFYVGRPGGAHIFTQTLAEHEAAKREARREFQAARSEARREARSEAVPGG